MPARLAVTEKAFACPLHPNFINVPPWLRATRYCSGVSDNELDDSLSLAASDVDGLSGSVADPALLPSSASRIARLKADDESSALCQRLSTSSNSNGLRLRNHFAAGWTSGSYRGAIRLSANARPHSSPNTSPKCTTSSRNLGTRPIYLASAPLLQPLSHPLTALKRKDTSICLLWMSRGRTYLPAHG